MYGIPATCFGLPMAIFRDVIEGNEVWLIILEMYRHKAKIHVLNKITWLSVKKGLKVA